MYWYAIGIWVRKFRPLFFVTPFGNTYRDRSVFSENEKARL
jgi:hypothetical protein